MRLRKFFSRGMTCSALLLVTGLLALTNVGCAEEVFECCQCKYQACTDPNTGLPVSICTCTQFTYEECGTYCHEELPAALEAQGITGCGEPASTLALDAC